MKQIKKLDTKYLVLKIEDLDKYFSGYQAGIFSTQEEQKIIDAIPFKKVLMDIDKLRRSEGKSINNEYVVLNQSDEIDLEDFITYIRNDVFDRPMRHYARICIRDIAVGIVNAILKAKAAQE